MELIAPRGASSKRGLQTGPSPGIQGSLPKILESTTPPLDEIVAAALSEGEPNAEPVLGKAGNKIKIAKEN